jgi:(p)ppGpp synthase/HD superfamily hydrolase
MITPRTRRPPNTPRARRRPPTSILAQPVPSLSEAAAWVEATLGRDAASPRGQSAAKQAAYAADFLAELQASPATIAAAYIHNFAQFDTVAAAALPNAWNSRVAWLCREAAAIAAAKPAETQRGKQRALQRVRLFIAAYRNPELALIMVAASWARLRAAQAGTPAQRHAFAEEARHILGPYLDMLGMRALREELGSWLRQLHEPDADRREQACQTLFAQVRQRVTERMPDATLVYRPRVQMTSAPNVGDPLPPSRSGGVAYLPIEVSLLMADEESCYRALFWLHRLFAPVDGSMVDDLRDGGINGARALQTTVLVPVDTQRTRVTFHICTPAMEEVNRWGLAARAARSRVQDHIPNAWWNQAAAGHAAIAAAPLGALADELHVFSPQGQLFRFHRGCTVVDFAYYLHTELADQCQRFYINDQVVEPTTPLHHLDLVALEHDPRAPGPTQVWLNAAHTSRARNSIDRFLKRRGLGVDQGQKILEQRLRALEAHYGFNLPDHRLPQATVNATRQYKLARVEELLAEIAAGRIVADRILHPLFADEIIRQIRLPRESSLRPHQMQLAQCCRPRPGEEIVGLPTSRQGVIHKLRVHRATCSRLALGSAPLPLSWRLQPRLKLMVQVEVLAHNEDRLLGGALDVIYSQQPRVILHKVEADAQHGMARLRFHIEAASGEVLDDIGCALQELPGRTVVEVRQLRLPPSELEAALQMGAAGGFNPYSRLPVYEQAMFFGRSQELTQIAEWLRAGAGNIWLIGQKRVGKTSLLFHLKHSYLRDRGFVPVFVDFQLLGNLATGNLFFEIANAVYHELRADPRVGDLGAPVAGVFAHQPPVQLITYLHSVQSRLGAYRLTLLLDEFSRLTDAYLQGEVARSRFDEWRGVIQATAPHISYITVFQQQTYHTLLAQQVTHDPCWHIMELGERLALKSLGPDDVRRLIELPMRSYLDYTPDTLNHVAQLTGGHPFLIHAFCFKLAIHMARQDRRQVEAADVEAVRQEFMQPLESVFAHFLDMIKGSGHSVTQQLVTLAAQRSPVTWAALHAVLPASPPDKLRRTLDALTANDILVQPAPDQWQFSSLLFQQWLALNLA